MSRIPIKELRSMGVSQEDIEIAKRPKLHNGAMAHLCSRLVSLLGPSNSAPDIIQTRL